MKPKPKESAKIHKKRSPIHSLHNLLVDARSGGDNHVEEPLFRQLIAGQKNKVQFTTRSGTDFYYDVVLFALLQGASFGVRILEVTFNLEWSRKSKNIYRNCVKCLNCDM